MVIRRPGPVVGVDVLVLHRCEHRVQARLADALRHTAVHDGNERVISVSPPFMLREAAAHGRLQRARQRHAVAGPGGKMRAGFVGRREALIDVGDRPADLARQVEAVAGNLQVVGRFAGYVGGVDQRPVERMRERMAGRVDVRQPEDAPRHRLERIRLLGYRPSAAISPWITDTGGTPAFQQLARHDFRRVGAPGISARDAQPSPSTCTSSMRRPPGGHVRHRRPVAREGGLEELDRIDHPARLFLHPSATKVNGDSTYAPGASPRRRRNAGRRRRRVAGGSAPATGNAQRGEFAPAGQGSRSKPTIGPATRSTGAHPSAPPLGEAQAA